MPAEREQEQHARRSAQARSARWVGRDPTAGGALGGCAGGAATAATTVFAALTAVPHATDAAAALPPRLLLRHECSRRSRSSLRHSTEPPPGFPGPRKRRTLGHRVLLPPERLFGKERFQEKKSGDRTLASPRPVNSPDLSSHPTSRTGRDQRVPVSRTAPSGLIRSTVR